MARQNRKVEDSFSVREPQSGQVFEVERVTFDEHDELGGREIRKSECVMVENGVVLEPVQVRMPRTYRDGQGRIYDRIEKV